MGEQGTTEEQPSEGACRAKNSKKGCDYCHMIDQWGEGGPKVCAAIDESVRRFLETNKENIRRSDKEEIASASYGGGMIDTIMVISNVFGSWGLEQFLAELGRMQKRDDNEEVHPVTGTCKDYEIERVSSAKEVRDVLEGVAEGSEDQRKRKPNDKKDPMFA